MGKRYLILDFGNTFQKCAIASDEGFDVHVFKDISLDDIQKLTHSFPVNAVILSSVIHFPAEIKSWLMDNYFFIELDHFTPIPIKNSYKTPDTLGKDRLAAAIGLAHLFPKSDALVIDCGTAIKYDFVSAKGEYLGGGIAPGMHMRFHALHTFTDKLPLVEFDEDSDLVGQDTLGSIRSGVINGVAAEIDGIIQQYQSRYPKLNIALTGGELKYFADRLKNAIFADPNLVLKGLQQILIFNEQNSTK
jgi:type III pantothenate kinase